MVKTLMSTLTMASVAAEDVTSLLQLSAGLRQSQGQRIVSAIAEEGTETICVPAAVGDIAPVTGSFTAIGSQQVVVVEAGSVANEAGSFCVAKQDVLLIQRTLGLNTARDFEVALGSKSRPATTTTTTAITDWDDFDFVGDLTKNPTVKWDGCPNVEAGLVQTVDASVSDKQRKKKADKNKLDADQLQVCGCRNFLKSTVNTPNFVETLQQKQAELEAAEGEGGEGEGANPNLLQRNFDTALASKKKKKAKTTTTTTTTIDHKLTDEFAALAQACTTVAVKLGPGHWTTAAKEINNPLYRDLFESFNITGGWQHCDRSWKVQGACHDFVLPNTDEVVDEVADEVVDEASSTEGTTDSGDDR